MVVVGPSGSGKSTLLNIIAGLDEPTSGQVSLGRDLQVNGKPRIGFVFQKDLLLPWRCVLENALLGAEVQGKITLALEERARQYIRRYGLLGFERAYPESLSQGMRHRVALIRSLMTGPKLLLLDEPFAALDYDVKLFLERELLSTVKSSDLTVILVTHDVEEAIAIGDRVTILSARPGQVKSITEIQLGAGQRDPIEARKHPKFRAYFAQLVEQLRYGTWDETAVGDEKRPFL